MKKLLLLLLLLAAPAAAQTEHAYGNDPRQRFDFTSGGVRDGPLVVFIHGGAWSFGDKRIAAHMAAHFRARGYAFAAINYRLAPAVTVGQQAEDVAAALASLGVGQRIPVLLIGHSAGAHLAALVGTDPRYLAAHRIPMGRVVGIVLLDGAGYDVPRQIETAGPLLRRMYLNAFGRDEAAQIRLSPITHAAAPNAAEFLILHVASRPDSRAQSEALAAALRAAGTPATVAAVEGTHSSIFRGFGGEDHGATALTDPFAARLFGSPR
ncbi:MAG TPA: alpha/beta hydrolase [Allosphingosinicella sp.]|nr:alpha/beta hydrolase [Allosphingosinicella sp.]